MKNQNQRMIVLPDIWHDLIPWSNLFFVFSSLSWYGRYTSYFTFSTGYLQVIIFLNYTDIYIFLITNVKSKTVDTSFVRRKRRAFTIYLTFLRTPHLPHLFLASVGVTWTQIYYCWYCYWITVLFSLHYISSLTF